jgi:hypothetical protein
LGTAYLLFAWVGVIISNNELATVHVCEMLVQDG